VNARRTNESGRDTIDVECPFCAEEVEADRLALLANGGFVKCPECGEVLGVEDISE
jgi:endogenous inhibitor of DNA gyrase (YacG/DUF329 family)